LLLFRDSYKRISFAFILDTEKPEQN